MHSSSATLSNLARWCSDIEEKYSQSQADLIQTSGFLDGARSLNSSLNAQLDSEKMAHEEEKRSLVASRDNLDKLYHDASTSLTILERSHRFTMSDLDHHRDELRASQDEVSRLGKLLSTKDSAIKELRASKKLVTQELEATCLTIKALEDDRVVMKAMCDKAMDKAIRAGQILMKRPGVMVPDDIVADVMAAPDAASHPSSSVAPANDAACKNTPAQLFA